MSSEVKVIENEDGSVQTEIPIESVTPFDPEQMDVDKIFNFQEMHKSLTYNKDGFTVHPYPKEDFSPVSVHDTLEMWNIPIQYHCKNDDMDCVIDVYAKALSKIDKEIKKNVGRKWGLYLMPDGYNLAIVHNYDLLMSGYNKLVAVDIKNAQAIEKTKQLRIKAGSALLASNIKRKK